jgi:hypothetical protein
MNSQLNQILAHEHIADMHRAAASRRLGAATHLPRRSRPTSPSVRAGALRARLTARTALTRP